MQGVEKDNDVLENIVLLHELGHDQLHRDSAIATGGFQEFNIFDMSVNRMEYEANIFVSQISLPDEEILDYIESGYDIQQIAGRSEKRYAISQGYRFRHLEHENTFLRYDK